MHVVGGLQLKGIEDEVFLYQVLPKSLKGRTYKGVFRRRDSEGGSIPGTIGGSVGDPEFVVTRGASILVGGEYLENKDMMCDVMSLTPVQLQTTVHRLRNKITALEDQLLASRRVSELDLDQSDSSEKADYEKAENSTEETVVSSGPISEQDDYAVTTGEALYD